MAILYRKTLTVAECLDKWGVPHEPVILPPQLYDDAEAQGIDLRGYVRQERIPRSERD